MFPREQAARKIGRPPCLKCPKCEFSDDKSPKAGRQATFHERNWQTFRLYLASKATFGRCLSKKAARDPIVRENFSVLEGIFMQWNHPKPNIVIGMGR